jgi:DNA-binding NarL/FixJ family response regulator
MLEKTSIVVADSQYLIRLGLNSLLSEQENIEIVAEATNESQLVSSLQHHHPQVVILDYNQESTFRKDTINLIQQTSPNTNILIISGDNDKSNIYDVIEAGINGFLTKSCDDKEIIDAIAATAKGEKFFCSRVLDYLLEKTFSKPDEKCITTPLTAREIEIVRLVAQGLIAKEIADQLNLSTHTVYTHRKNIMKKLKLNTASELTLYAINTGIIESN